MQTFKILTGIMIHIVLIPVWGIFIYAIWEKELVLALLCPVIFGACKGMWHEEVVRRETVRFEIIEYQKDDTGKEEQITAYEIEQFDLSKTIDRLNEEVKCGRISRFEVAYV